MKMRVRSFLAVCVLLGLVSYAAASDALTVIDLIFSTLLTFGVVSVTSTTSTTSIPDCEPRIAEKP
jgi:hypothetical protein